jgi:integrase/recombinase XerC
MNDLMTLTPTLPTLTGSDVLDAWLAGRNAKTLAAYAADLGDFARFVGAASPEAAVDALLALGHGGANRVALAYKANLVERGLSTATVARRLATLRSMVKVARLIGRITWSLDVESPRVTAYRDTRGPGLDDWHSMVGKAVELATGDNGQGKRDLALLRLMRDMGLRRGEVAAMDLADVCLEESNISIVGKGQSEPISLTLPDSTKAALTEWIAARGDQPGPLFVRLDRAGAGGGRLTGDSICRMVKQMSQRAGLRREARPHGMRHSAITRLLDLTNGDVRRVQRFSRHAKVETVLRYDDNRRDDAGALAAMLSAD